MLSSTTLAREVGEVREVRSESETVPFRLFAVPSECECLRSPPGFLLSIVVESTTVRAAARV